MDVRFDELFEQPENEVFRIVFFPDRIYHARYLSATRSSRYRYACQRGALRRGADRDEGPGLLRRRAAVQHAAPRVLRAAAARARARARPHARTSAARVVQAVDLRGRGRRRVEHRPALRRDRRRVLRRAVGDARAAGRQRPRLPRAAVDGARRADHPRARARAAAHRHQGAARDRVRRPRGRHAVPDAKADERPAVGQQLRSDDPGAQHAGAELLAEHGRRQELPARLPARLLPRGRARDRPRPLPQRDAQRRRPRPLGRQRHRDALGAPARVRLGPRVLPRGHDPAAHDRGHAPPHRLGGAVLHRRGRGDRLHGRRRRPRQRPVPARHAAVLRPGSDARAASCRSRAAA